MARFQTLPDRTDCITTSIPDITMCQNYGMVTSCNLSITIAGKNQLLVYGNCCCAWTVPTGVCSIVIEAWGAGGGGGGYSECCCCAHGPGGGAGGYIAATIPTTPGCQYTICTGPGGDFAVGNSTNGGQGSTTYVTGYNLNNFCAVGGTGGCMWTCNTSGGCYGANTNSNSCGVIGSSTYLGNVIMACGEGGHQFGRAYGCRADNKGGSAPMGGGLGGWGAWTLPCCSRGYTGGFPGGGGSGIMNACCCAHCQCATCGGAGLVRIWY